MQVITHCRREYEKMLAENPENLDPILNIPGVYAQLHDRENMLKYLRKFEEKGFYIGIQDMIRHSSIFDPYRNDPELNAILEREQKKKSIMRAQVRAMGE